MDDKPRCSWMGDDPLMIAYHDDEYGIPVSDNNVIFERLMLEIYQAGLTWRLVLNRRAGFNKVFHNYDLKKVAKMTEKQLEALYDNPDIIRNKLKINTGNANAGTGQQGHDDAVASCKQLAQVAGCSAEEVLPFSTGVIGEYLPMDKLSDGIKAAHGALTEDN